MAGAGAWLSPPPPPDEPRLPTTGRTQQGVRTPIRLPEPPNRTGFFVWGLSAARADPAGRANAQHGTGHAHRRRRRGAQVTTYIRRARARTTRAGPAGRCRCRWCGWWWLERVSDVVVWVGVCGSLPSCKSPHCGRGGACQRHEPSARQNAPVVGRPLRVVINSHRGQPKPRAWSAKLGCKNTDGFDTPWTTRSRGRDAHRLVVYQGRGRRPSSPSSRARTNVHVAKRNRATGAS